MMTRRRLVENIVITSHTRLKKHFLSVEIHKLMERFRLANTKFLQLKENVDNQKALYYQQLSEKQCLGIWFEVKCFFFNPLIFVEGQAGILTNIPMLRDFKHTEEEVASHLRTNEKMKIRLRNWWEGWDCKA